MRRSVCLALTLLSYAIVAFIFRDQWELTRDDAEVLSLALRTANAGPWAVPFGVTTSLGVSLPPWCAYLYAIPLKLGGLRAVQTLIIGLLLGAHWLLIRVGEELKNFRTGWIASLAYFLTPTFFCFYNQKFWVVATLPFFLLVALLNAILYLKDSSRPRRRLFAVFLPLALAVGFHSSAFLFFPVALLLFSLGGPRPRTEYAVALALSLLGLWPALLWLETRHPLLLAALTALAVGAGELLPRLRELWAEWIALGFAAALFGAAALWSPGLVAAYLRVCLDLWAGWNSYIGFHVGYPHADRPWILSLLPELPLLLIFLAARHRESLLEQRLFRLWLLVPLSLGLVGTIGVENVPHQWLVFSAPAVFLAFALGLERLPAQARLVLSIAWLSGMAALSWQTISRVRSGGGEGWHLPSLGTKLAVLDRIHRSGLSPSIFVVKDPQAPLRTYGVGGWVAAEHEWLRKNSVLPAGEASAVYYLYEEGSLDSRPADREMLSRLPGVSIERILSVFIFRVQAPIPGLGLKIR